MICLTTVKGTDLSARIVTSFVAAMVEVLVPMTALKELEEPEKFSDWETRFDVLLRHEITTGILDRDDVRA